MSFFVEEGIEFAEFVLYNDTRCRGTLYSDKRIRGEMLEWQNMHDFRRLLMLIEIRKLSIYREKEKER